MGARQTTTILVEYVEKGLLPKGKALDICCGAGTNTVYLAQSGFDLTGIDISKTALEIAKKKTRQAKVDINFLAESFITTVCPKNSFRLLGFMSTSAG